jgi:D-serine deaminase-like pyridoxal phosphate-dependent protein
VDQAGATRAALTRRQALGATAATAAALALDPGTAGASAPHGRAPALGSGGVPMEPPAIAPLAKQVGKGEPVAFVDLAAVDRNCDVLLGFSRQTGMAWRPAFKTLESPDLLAYVVAKLDRPRAMIHHLRTLPQALERVPSGTDFLMGYPPSLGELESYVTTRPRRERRHKLRINVDSLALLRALDELSKRSARRLPLDIVLEIEDFRGGIVPGEELAEALRILRAAKDRLRLGALLCYDTLAAANGDPTWRSNASSYAQRRIGEARAQIGEQAADFVDVAGLIVNGPGSAGYRNWAGSNAANEFSAGSAILFANYLDNGYDTEGLHKALYLCAPVLRVPAHTIGGLPAGVPAPLPGGMEIVLIKAGGWPTGNNPTLSKIVHPTGVQESSVAGNGYGRGANSSGMILAPTGSLELGDYVVETCQQVMEGQDYFGALQAAREGRVRAVWPTLTRWASPKRQ